MHRVIQHDGLAAGLLNRDYTGGTGQYVVWKSELCNTDSLLELISNRLMNDYVTLNAKQRKPVSHKDLDTWMMAS